MIKRSIIKKLFIILSIFLVIYLVRLFPSNNNEINNSINNGYIYLLDNNNYVSRVDYVYKYDDLDSKIKEIIDVITDKDKKIIRKGFNPVLDKNTKLIDYSINDNILSLNFNKDFSKGNIIKKIECLTYSLTEIDNINGISIRVNGNSLDNIPSVIDRTYGINKEVSLSTMDNINYSTIFYPAKLYDYNYYVPVTKINNEEKEKIEIIIEELKNSTTYNSNFINCINKDTKLIDFNLSPSSLFLYFDSKYLTISDIDEEVKYAIKLSVENTYNYKDISVSIK